MTNHRTVSMIVLLIAAGFALSMKHAATAREWTDSTGEYTVQAELIAYDGQRVTLEKDGRRFELPLTRLSQKDRDYLKQLSSGKSDEPTVSPPASASPVENRSRNTVPSAPPSVRPPDQNSTRQVAPDPTPTVPDPQTIRQPAVDPPPTEPANQTAPSGTSSMSLPQVATDSGFIVLTYQGQTLRVPVNASGSGQLELDEVSLRKLMGDPPVSASDVGTDSAVASSPTATADVKGAANTPAADAVADTNTAVATDAPVANSGPSASSVTTMAVLGAVIVGLLGYFFVFEPLRKQKPLREAIRIIERDQRALFPQAEDLLNQSLLGGLRRKNVAVARFALAHLRCQMGKYDEAATVLSDLEKSGAKIDRPTAYLMLWTQSKLKNHERVERIYNEYEGMLQGYKQSALIVSISYMGLAFLRLARREINGALHYFDLVRTLNVLADEVPSHLDDHEVVAGVAALFEKNKDEAVKHFEAAVKTADERGKPNSNGHLGLLLCQWQEESLPDIDAPLAAVLTQMQPETAVSDGVLVGTQCPHCEKTYTLKSSYVGKRVQCKEEKCRRRFVVEKQTDVETESESDTSEDRLFSESDLLLRNTLLWHCIARLAVWLDGEEQSGLSDAELKLIRDRLQLVIDLDPDFGDPHLLGGLINFYFAKTEEDRKLGREMIDRAVELEVHVPEVLQLLDRINKLASLSEHSLSYFHQLSNQYAGNEEVDPKLRDRFVRNMSRFSRFRELGDIDRLPPDRVSAPTLENLQGRGQILRNRVSNIVRFNLAEEKSDVKEEIVGRLGDLEEKSQVLTKEAKAFQETELQLMESTGEFLFQDESDDA